MDDQNINSASDNTLPNCIVHYFKVKTNLETLVAAFDYIKEVILIKNNLFH